MQKKSSTPSTSTKSKPKLTKSKSTLSNSSSSIATPHSFEYDPDDASMHRNIPQPAMIDEDEIIICHDNSQWKDSVQLAMINLQKLPLNASPSLTMSDLFTQDNARYIVKGRRKNIFEIFPWFLIHKKNKMHRFRESLKPGIIELIIDALNFFWTNHLSKNDFLVIEEFCRTPPKRCLTSILALKQEIEKNRESRRAEEFMKERIEDHEQRLTRLEKQTFAVTDLPPFKKLRSRDLDEIFQMESQLDDQKSRIESLELNLPDGTENGSHHRSHSYIPTSPSSSLWPYPFDTSSFRHNSLDPNFDFDDTEVSYSPHSHELSEEDIIPLHVCLSKTSSDAVDTVLVTDSSASSSPPIQQEVEYENMNIQLDRMRDLLNQIRSHPNTHEIEPPLDLISFNATLTSINLTLHSYKRQLDG